MASTFKLNAINYPSGYSNSAKNGFWVEVNSDESQGMLVLLVYTNENGNAITPTKLILNGQPVNYKFTSMGKGEFEKLYQATIPFANLTPHENTIEIHFKGSGPITIAGFFEEDQATSVKLERAAFDSTKDEVLWPYILKSIPNFPDYQTFIDYVLEVPNPKLNQYRNLNKGRSPFIRSEEYNLVKFATDFYMLATLNLDPGAIKSYLMNGRYLPYYEFVIGKMMADISGSYNFKKEVGDTKSPAFFDKFPHLVAHLNSEIPGKYIDDADKSLVGQKLQNQRLDNPIFIELIWNYWMEQGMLVQTMNMINLRFQNIKVHNGTDPLQRFDADPLRPLSHLLWGYIQDEQHRLSINRRYHEYDHQ